MPVKKYSCDQIEKMIADLAFPEYRELKECRDVVDDCLAGQRTIKEKCKYLPANDWQKTHDDQYRSLPQTCDGRRGLLHGRFRPPISQPKRNVEITSPNPDARHSFRGARRFATVMQEIHSGNRQKTSANLLHSAGLRMLF